MERDNYNILKMDNYKKEIQETILIKDQMLVENLLMKKSTEIIYERTNFLLKCYYFYIFYI
jgi:hypothetical protein